MPATRSASTAWDGLARAATPLFAESRRANPTVPTNGTEAAFFCIVRMGTSPDNAGIVQSAPYARLADDDVRSGWNGEVTRFLSAKIGSQRGKARRMRGLLVG